MYNFFVDIVIWSFAIFGLLTFLKEFAIDFLCRISTFVYIFVKKIIAKTRRKLYNVTKE